MCSKLTNKKGIYKSFLFDKTICIVIDHSEISVASLVRTQSMLSKCVYMVAMVYFVG